MSAVAQSQAASARGTPPGLTIIGPGRVGCGVGRLLFQAGKVRIVDLLSRTSVRAAASLALIGAGRPIFHMAELEGADLFLLSVPDDAIASCADALAASGCVRPGAIAFHCSGAQTAERLASLRAAGAHVASVHPIRSFADPATVAASFQGTFCGVEGDPLAVARLTGLFEAVGARIIPIDPSRKTLYHAAAVFSSNYLVTLIDVAIRNYGAAGVDPGTALQMIEPLLRETVDNVFRMGPAAALTGPVARGDADTIRQHHDALEQANPAHAALYAHLAEATRALAATRPT